jgi:hypothetical protein
MIASPSHTSFQSGAQAPSTEAISEMAQQMSSGGGAGQSTLSPQQAQALQQQAGMGDASPREVGTLKEELITRPLADITKGIRSIFSVETLLGVENTPQDPALQAKKKQTHQRFSQLTQEEQAVARERFQREMERKQKMVEEEQIRKQQAAQQKVITMPSSPQKGPAGPAGSKKQKAMQQLQDDRTKIGTVQGAN